MALTFVFLTLSCTDLKASARWDCLIANGIAFVPIPHPSLSCLPIKIPKVATLSFRWSFSNQIVIRSWTTSDGKRMLYQEDALATILDVEALLEQLPKDEGLPADGLVLFSGTVATKIGLVYGERFDFEMEDPLLDRKIRHGYQIRVLPQYL